MTITIVGGGVQARDCGVLSGSGFSLAHSFEVETGDRSPIIPGEVQGAFQLAREAVQSGRHVLIAGSHTLTPERLELLLESRRLHQDIFVWSERHFHPGYCFVTGLLESDASWCPRYVRHETLSTEAPSGPLLRWRTLEAITLMAA